MSDDKGRFIQFEHAEKINFNKNSIGFLPNGDLILVSLNYETNKYSKFKNDKIYSYSVENKPTNTTFWKCSQIHELEFTGTLTDFIEVSYFVCQTKLFVLIRKKKLMFQWNLLTMTFDKQYFFDRSNFGFDYKTKIVINKNQTLLAFHIYNIYDKIYKFCVFSMETGMQISSYG